MIYIRKNKVPDFFTIYKKKNPDAIYDSDSFREISPVLHEELVKEQRGLCAYCCSKIHVENSHNEHIEPRHMKDGTYSRKSLDYDNIVASCNKKNTCGNQKKDEYDAEKFISPLQEECEQVFSYDPDGYMRGDDYTISLLNLNSYELRSARKSVYRMIMNGEKYKPYKY